MVLTKRQWTLAGVCIVMLVVNLAQGTWSEMLNSEQDAAASPQSLLQSEIEREQSRLRSLNEVQSRFVSIRGHSLPRGPSIATTLYHNWLVTVLRDAGVKQAAVTPGRPIAEPGVGHRVRMTVQGQFSVKQLSDVFERFDRTPLLHRVNSVTITAGDPGQPQTVSLAIEALSLESAEDRQVLLPEGATELTGDWPTLSTVLADSRTFGDPPPATVKSEVPAAPPRTPTIPQDHLRQIRLIGVVDVGSKREGWLWDSAKRQEYFAATDGVVTIVGEPVRVLGSGKRYILLDCQAGRFRVRIGQSLREAIQEAGLTLTDGSPWAIPSSERRSSSPARDVQITATSH